MTIAEPLEGSRQWLTTTIALNTPSKSATHRKRAPMGLLSLSLSPPPRSRPRSRPDLERAADLARQEKAQADAAGLQKRFRDFRGTGAGDRGAGALPASLRSSPPSWRPKRRGIKPATIGRRVAAIRYAHKLVGHRPIPTDDERVKATVRGIRRSLGAAPRKKAPATAERIISMASAPATASRDCATAPCCCSASLAPSVAPSWSRSIARNRGMRDRAEDHDPPSKTDQEGVGATIAIVRGSIACPVAAVKAWRDGAGITSGPLFRSIRKGGKIGARLTAQSVADIVKSMPRACGLEPAQFAGHSLRAGFLTSAAKRGASIFKMMDVSRHRSVDTLRGYVRDAEMFQDHAGAGLL